MSGASVKRTASAEGTERLGAALAPALRAGDIVVLSGELGAGKTRFVGGLARAFDPARRVRSPSFTLVNEYAGTLPLYHLDLYRLATRDVDALGLEESAAQGALLVEWGERLPAHWRTEALTLAFAAADDDSRTIAAHAGAGRGLELLAHWRSLPEAW